ncbi:hypothetical protein RRG08_001469 [Elysia crispata]|uniref:Uncharacterized protein n=1 Tax=Elysia crispata TaxID=231223 RepID=A0AAE0YEW8_9GAST|nr:hypothetical protein RRG08_001469 [Elysia crispata]
MRIFLSRNLDVLGRGSPRSSSKTEQLGQFCFLFLLYFCSVEASDVQKAIDDAASSFSGVVAVSSLFDEPLTYEANKMDAALCLLNTLDTKAKEQEGAGESTQATVAAMSMTAQAMQDILADSASTLYPSPGATARRLV